MKVFAPRRWRKWATVLLGGHLFIAPWIFGTSGDRASSANAWIVGACTVVTTLRVPIVSGPRTAEPIKVWLGAWLLASAFVLGFAGSSAAWNAWIVGALILTLADTLRPQKLEEHAVQKPQRPASLALQRALFAY